MMISNTCLAVFAALSHSHVNAFTVSSNIKSRTVASLRPFEHTSIETRLFDTVGPNDEEIESMMEKTKLTDEEIENVGNLVTDDEWMGLGMELSEIVRCAVLEEAKKNTADFIGKEDYKIGDITKEIDTRVKASTIVMHIYGFKGTTAFVIICLTFSLCHL